MNKPLTDFYDQLWTLSPAPDVDFQTELFRAMFPDFEKNVVHQVPDQAVIFDVGCGPAVAGIAYFGKVAGRIKAYHCVDESHVALDQASHNLSKRGFKYSVYAGDLHALPFADGIADVIFCPGVLHYQDDMRAAIEALSKKLKIGGRIITWIYRQQKPLRRLTDEWLRSVIAPMDENHAQQAMAALTHLGIALGETKAKITLPDIPVLGVTAGTYDLQRFFYYYILKLFYSPRLSFQQHVINNLNAFRPQQVAFLEEGEIMRMFVENGYDLETWNASGNGIGIVARRTGLTEEQAAASCPQFETGEWTSELGDIVYPEE